MSNVILLKAKALLEAACDMEDLKDVKEDLEEVTEKIDEILDGCDTKKDDDKKDDDETKATNESIINIDLIRETIDRLYEKAALCESADDAEVYVQKAEELQKAIDDIPEEIPVVDDEYPADDVTGGEGVLCQEDIRELVGDDEEAMKLLQCGEGSITIDAQNESIGLKDKSAKVGVKDKSTDKVVQTFKTNEEAMEWVANNGGNSKYQLTNRLK